MRKVALTEVCGFQGGSQPPKSVWKKDIEPGYVRMLQIRDFTQPEKNKIEFVPDKTSLKKCRANDILIGRYGASIGKICHGLAGAYNVALIRVIPDEGMIQRDFLLHLLKSGEFQHFIQNIGGRAAQAGFNKEDLTEFKFFLPPLEEQKKIAAILDAADAYRQKTKALIDKYDQLTQSLFLDMFGDPLTNPKGWRKAPLGEVIVSKTGSINPLNFPNELFEYFSIPAYDKGQPEITLGSSIGSSKKHFQPGDVLLSRIVPHIRRCWIIPEGQGYRQIGSGEWIVFKSSDVNPNFLRFYLTSDFFHAQFMKTIKGVGGSLMRADIGQVKRLKFYTPPQDVQLEFNEMVVKIEKQKHQAEASLVKAEELFSSLLQRAFKGEITS